MNIFMIFFYIFRKIRELFLRYVCSRVYMIIYESVRVFRVNVRMRMRVQNEIPFLEPF